MDFVCQVSTTASVGDLARKTRADVAEHGAVTLLAQRAQARKLRRLQAALRADGYETHYVSDDSQHVLTVTAHGQEIPRVTGWWRG